MGHNMFDKLILLKLNLNLYAKNFIFLVGVVCGLFHFLTVVHTRNFVAIPVCV